MEQKAHGFAVWSQPMVQLRLPSAFNLRSRSDTLLIAWSAPATKRAREVIAPSGVADPQARTIRPDMRANLVEAIATRRRWVEELISGRVTGLEELAKRQRCSPRTVRMTLNLAFLAPPLVKAAIEGTLPQGCGLTMLADTPAEWERQREIMTSCASSMREGKRVRCLPVAD
jgi:site-specific DNA recombinase